MLSVSIAPTVDGEIIRRIVSDPRVYAAVTDDFCVPAAEYQPDLFPGITHILVSGAGAPLGVFKFVPENHICWEVHTCLLPALAGAPGARAAVLTQEWVWRNTPCLRIVTKVPEFNIIALHFARKAGMQIYGVNPDCFMRGGKLHAEILLGMTKPANLSYT